LRELNICYRLTNLSEENHNINTRKKTNPLILWPLSRVPEQT